MVILHSAFGTRGTAQAPFDRGRTTTHEVGHWLNLRHIWGDTHVDDAAMYMFSAGQVTRINATLAGPRKRLGRR